MKKASIVTFGCKLNQYETQLMIEELSGEYEFVDFNSSCDLYIINSCAVTAKAAKESRQKAKKAFKINPKAAIIYTGCDSYLEDDLNAIIVGNSYKQNIKKALENRHIDVSDSTKTYPINSTLNNYQGRSRAFIKIQEGCNNHCTYCIIPKLRGKERDKEFESVIKEIDKLKKFPEIVLTGTNIGSYKRLKELLRKLSDFNSDMRIRISSIEPMYVDSELIDIIAEGRFAKHLHIPLQSGSDKILKLMGRDYTTKKFEKIVNECAKRGIFVGVDVIVGFYSEDDKEFKKTYDFIDSLPVSYGHVFTYSKRPLTSALNIGLKLERGPVVKERNAALKELFKKKFRESVAGMVGKKTGIIIEPTTIKRNSKTYYKAVASEYFTVLTQKKQNGIVEVKIGSFDGEYAYL